MEFKPDENASILGDYLERINKIKEIKEKYKDKKIGITASCFDLLHPGHISLLEDAKSMCDVLVVALQTDPTLDRKSKNLPVQSFEGRLRMISSIKYVDEVIKYSYESDLYELLKELMPDVRIIGTDWQGKHFTGDDLKITIYWHDRDWTWSTSGLRKIIWERENERIAEEKN